MSNILKGIVNEAHYPEDPDEYEAMFGARRKPKRMEPDEPQEPYNPMDDYYKKQDAAQAKYNKEVKVEYSDKEGVAPNGERYNSAFVVRASNPYQGDNEIRKFEDLHWGAKKIVDTVKKETKDVNQSFLTVVYYVDNHKYGTWRPWKDEAPTQKPLTFENPVEQFGKVLEGISQEDLANTLCHRIEMRYPDIYKKYDYDAMYNAVDDVASFHAGREELGNSDINIMIRQVFKRLEESEGLDEGIARGPKEKKLFELLEAWGYFISLKTSKIANDAIDNNASQELRAMQRHYLGPVMNGMSFVDITKSDLWQNPKAIPHLLKYIYQGIPYIEERIKKFVNPASQPSYLSGVEKIKQLYKEVVAQYSQGQQGVTEGSSSKLSSPFEGGKKTTSITPKHKPLVWENMLGTVMAKDPTLKAEPKYFDYRWEDARAYAKVDQCDDLRICKSPGLYQGWPEKGKMALWGIPRQGVAEGLDEAVGGNYLYHGRSAYDAKEILASGYIPKAKGPQKATQAQTKMPTVSVTRDWGYASGSNAQTQMAGIGRDIVFVLDRNAVESHFKTLGTSQSQHIKGLAFNPYLTKDGGEARSQNTDSMARANAKGKSKYAEPTAKAGGEFEEAVVVPKGALPLKGTMVGFWVNPKSELINDPTIMNDPRRLDMARPNQFVKAKQEQGVAEEKGTLWRVHQSEATGRYHVVKGYNKDIKMYKNKMGAGDFNSKDAAQAKADELNNNVSEDQLDELKCWDGHKRVPGTKAGDPGSCEEINEIFNPTSGISSFLRSASNFISDYVPVLLGVGGTFVATSAVLGPVAAALASSTVGTQIFQTLQNQQNKVPGMIQQMIEKYVGSEQEAKEFMLLHAKTAYLEKPEFRWRGQNWPVTLKKDQAEAIVEKFDKLWLEQHLAKEKESGELNEYSTDRLAKYKTAAPADARAADKARNFARGNKRFAGIVKATKKQFDNETKPKKESAIMKGLVDENLGTPYPGTYEQEFGPFKRKGQERTMKIAFEGKKNVSRRT